MKKESVEDIGRALDLARTKRDAFAAGITTLDARIVELEARLSEQAARRAREQVESELEELIARLQHSAARLGSDIVALSDAAEITTALIPEAHGLHEFLKAADAEIGSSLDLVLRELRRRREAVRTGLLGSTELPQVKVALERLNGSSEPARGGAPTGERNGAHPWPRIFGAGWWSSPQKDVESRV